MASDSTRLNNMKKFYQMLLSGQLGLAGGAFDPMAVAEEQQQETATPITEMYLNSSNPDVRGIFSGLASGQIDPIDAKNQLVEAFGVGAETAPLYSAVDKVVGELSKTRSSKPTSIYGKGYLPNPLEQFTDNPQMAPLLPKAQAAVSDYDRKVALLKKVTSGGRPTVDASVNPQFNFSAISPEFAKKVSSLRAPERARLFRMLQSRLGESSKARENVIGQNAALLAQAGRTPFTETLSKRAALLGQFMGK